MIEIQISNPLILNIREDSDSNIEEAIETIFPLDTEYAFLIWDHIFIPLSYKYDISVMVLDFINMHHFINDDKPFFKINWASNTFASVWTLIKVSDSIKINSTWNCVLGELTNLLNLRQNVMVKSKDLDSEIVKLLNFLKNALKRNGYNSDILSDLHLLDGI